MSSIEPIPLAAADARNESAELRLIDDPPTQRVEHPDAATMGRLPDLGEYPLKEVSEAAAQNPSPPEALGPWAGSTRPPEPVRPRVPLGVLVHIAILAVAGLAIYCWPEDEEQRRLVDANLSLAARAEKLVEQGQYRAATVQYSTFLARVDKSGIHVGRQDRAVDKARRELVRIRPLAAAQSTSPTNQPAVRTGTAPPFRVGPLPPATRRGFP